MAQVETVRGPIDVTSLGTTLMHEHVFVRNEEIQLNYPAGWDEQERIEYADPAQVVMSHSGGTTDLDYLGELADAGCLLGMDRFGLNVAIPAAERVATVAVPCDRGYAGSMVLSHDASCHIDWFPWSITPGGTSPGSSNDRE